MLTSVRHYRSFLAAATVYESLLEMTKGLHGKAVPARMWGSRHAELKGASAPVCRPCMASVAVHGNQAATVAGHMPSNARYCLFGGLARRHAAPHGLNDLRGPKVSAHWDMAPYTRPLTADGPAAGLGVE